MKSTSPSAWRAAWLAALIAAPLGAVELTCPEHHAGSALRCERDGRAGWSRTLKTLQWDFAPLLGWYGVADIPFAEATLLWAKLSCQGDRSQAIVYDVLHAPAWDDEPVSLLDAPAILPALEYTHQVWLSTVAGAAVVRDGDRLEVTARTETGVAPGSNALLCSIQILALPR